MSYLFASTFKKFIKNINGFFAMKPSSKSQALLQVYVHEGTFVYHTKMLGNAISFEKMWVLFTKTYCVDRGFCPSGRAGELSLRFPFTLNDSFSLPLVLHKLLSAILKS